VEGVFKVQVVQGGMWIVDYDRQKGGEPKHFMPLEGEGVELARIRREFRGIVIGVEGSVAARVFHKLWNIHWEQDRGSDPQFSIGKLEGKRVVEVLEKLDGQMVYGIVVDGKPELWTRKGETPVGSSAMHWTVAAGSGALALVAEVHEVGATATFEYVGKQSRIKANEGMGARLVLIAVRDKDSGVYWRHEGMVVLAKLHDVQVVVRHVDLEKVALRDMVERIRKWKDKEGVIVRFHDGQMVKVKSKWWFNSAGQVVRRWPVVEHRERYVKAQAKRRRYCETVQQRLVVTNAQNETTPEYLFRLVPHCQLVDRLYDRGNGRLRVVVMAFEQNVSDSLFKAVEESCKQVGLRIKRARGRLARSSSEWVVCTTWKMAE
jgi:hypothetical protein